MRNGFSLPYLQQVAPEDIARGSVGQQLPRQRGVSRGRNLQGGEAEWWGWILDNETELGLNSMTIIATYLGISDANWQFFVFFTFFLFLYVIIILS